MDTREDSVTCVGEIAIDREGYKPLIVQIQMKPTHRDKMKIDAVSGTLDLLAYFVKYSLFLSANIPSRNNYQRKYLST